MASARRPQTRARRATAGLAAAALLLTVPATFAVPAAAQPGVPASARGSAVTADPVTEPPDEPLLPLATAAGRRAQLSWQPPATGQPPTGYQVRYRETGALDWTEWTPTPAPADPTAAVAEEVTGLTGGVTYDLEVASVNAAGRSAFVAFNPVTPWDAGVPGGLTATSTDRAVTLAWTAPAPDPGHPLLGYAVEYRSTAAWIPWTRTGAATSTTETVTGLTNGVAYQFRVALIDYRGTGPWTAAVTATPSNLPGPPLGLLATAGDARVELTWSPPSDPGATPVTGYLAQYRAGGTGPWSDWDRTGKGTTAADTVTGLVNGTAYEFRVAATNAGGTGPFSGTVSATPAKPGPTGEPGPFCSALFGKTSGGTVKRAAREMMAGTVSLPPYGWFSIASTPPKWGPQPTVDTAGDRYINSLDWSLPLLYRGVRYNQSMFDRFAQLLDGWWRDHKPKSRKDPWIDHPIYGGFRVMTYVCAAQTFAGSDMAAESLRSQTTKRMLREANRQLRRFSAGGNNTEIHGQLGAMTAYCLVGDQGNATRAWANLTTMADRLIRPDGSDTEGAPGYGAYAVEMLMRAHAAAHLCAMPGIVPDDLLGRIAPASEFLAQATRPDFDMETIGDTKLNDIPDNAGQIGAAALWTWSKGAQGAPPTRTFASYSGGYVYGRSAFAAPGQGRPTFYSVRTANGRPPHGHDDGQAVTFFADGAEWFADAGVGAYDGSSFRRYVIGRSAHSVALVPGSARPTSLVAADTDGTTDRTCVRRGSTRVDHVRCVYYSRPGDALLVVDLVRAKAPTSRRAARDRLTVDQRWLLPTGVGATGSGRSWGLSSGASRASVLLTEPGRVTRAGSGSYDGWLAQKYGKPTKGSLLRQSVRIPAGKWRGKKKGGTPGAARVVATLIAPGAGPALALTRDEQGRLVATIGRGGGAPVTLVTARDLDLIGG